MSKKVAFVTGASNVTGKAIALEMAKAGYNVIGFTYAGNEDGAKKTKAEIEQRTLELMDTVGLARRCRCRYLWRI